MHFNMWWKDRKINLKGKGEGSLYQEVKFNLGQRKITLEKDFYFYYKHKIAKLMKHSSPAWSHKMIPCFHVSFISCQNELYELHNMIHRPLPPSPFLPCFHPRLSNCFCIVSSWNKICDNIVSLINNGIQLHQELFDCRLHCSYIHV